MKWMAGVPVFVCAMVVSSQEAPSNPPKPKEVRIHLPPGRRIQATDKVTPAKLITKVSPVYPPLARQTKISGIVTFHATIGTDGSVSELELISGHPLLVKAALDAVKQWKYEPTKLNGEAVEVDTTIDVVFSLQDKPAASSQPSTKN